MELWKMIAAALVAALVLTMFMRGGGASAQDVAAAKAKVSQGALLLDVRTPQEYAASHIEGAVNIPVQQLSARLGELGQRDREIVVYCRSGARSAQATRTLRGAGFSAVQDIGPMSAWQR